MTNLTKPRQQSWEMWRDHRMTLASGQKVWRGSEVGLNRATQKVQKMGSDPDLLYIGTAKEDVDATDGDRKLNVDFGQEFKVRWWANDTTSPVQQIGGLVYALDDQTATRDASYAPIGIAWAISDVDGVLVQKLAPSLSDAGGVGGAAPEVSLPAWASNNSVLLDVVNGGVYEIPATAAASTVTLPADAEEGTAATFVANGVDNAHTVQYRDATGPVAITTALTALKRHMVFVIMVNGAWRANAYVSP